MKSKMVSQVEEFYNAFDVPIIEKPLLASKDRFLLRLNVMQEELHEFIMAVLEEDIIAVADSLGDLIYVVIGTALEYGIPLDEVVDEIHQSNMTKLGIDGKPIYRKDGKVLKGPNYKKPDIKKVLES